MAHYELRPFAPAEAEQISHWAATPDDFWRVTGDHDFPLTAAQVNAWNRECNYAFTLRRDGDLVAYGEIVEDEVENDAEIQHVLVAPDVRGAGIGKALVSRLCAFLAAASAYPEVWFRAGRDNEPAFRCAVAVGFVEAPALSGPRYQWLKKPLRGEEAPPPPIMGE